MFEFVLDTHYVVSCLIDFIHRHPRGVICLRGPTASGKTSISLSLASDPSFLPQQIHLISADSRQIYRGMDIATDKIDPETRSRIPHHQIDLVDPDQIYTAGQRKQDVDLLITQLHQTGAYPVIVGGTGLYIDTIYHNFSLPAVPADLAYRAELEKMESDQPGVLYQMLSEIDPVDAKLHHPHSTRFIIRSLEIAHQTGIPKSQLFVRQDLPYPVLMAGIIPPAEYSNHLIDIRVDEMIDRGLISEVQGLIQSGYGRQHVAMNGIGYAEALNYLDGLTDLTECIRLIKQHTHQYAKKQRTRMRKYVRDSQTAPRPGVEYLIVQ